MPTTRAQATAHPEDATDTKLSLVDKAGEKRAASEVQSEKEGGGEPTEPPTKRTKVSSDKEDTGSAKSKVINAGQELVDSSKRTDAAVHESAKNKDTTTLERGHIYFFYRPRVEIKEAHNMNEVKNLHMLLLPRPAILETQDASTEEENEDESLEKDESEQMNVALEGGDAVPEKEGLNGSRKPYRLIRIGKKRLPEPNDQGASRGQVFWACVAAAGDDLAALEKALGENTYETATLGTRHEEPARLLARGAYALVLNEGRIPSERAAHLGYHISHPKELGDIQKTFGIHAASSYVLQVKNPLAPSTGTSTIPDDQKVKYSNEVMTSVFGKGAKGRKSYGLKFAPCEKVELLDEGAELLLIAEKEGEEGLEESLGHGRGEALRKEEEAEGSISVQDIFRELAMDANKFPAQPVLSSEWI